jgi:hypothetical protein
MKKFLFCFLMILLFCFSIQAAPFLVSDTYPASTNLDGFKVQIDGGSWVTVPVTVNADGTKQIKYDMAPLNLADGNHTGNVKAYNMWSESATTPFSFSKNVPAAPATLRLSAQ